MLTDASPQRGIGRTLEGRTEPNRTAARRTRVGRTAAGYVAVEGHVAADRERFHA